MFKITALILLHLISHVINMKILLTLLTVLVVSQAIYTQSFTEEELQNELSSTKSIWLVHRTDNPQINDNVQRVAEILRGFFKVATIASSDNSLSLYGDDRNNPIEYTGDFVSQDIVTFTLKNLDKFIQTRAKEAKSLKDYQEFLQKEQERAKKQWQGEQELRKKSNTLLLEAATWESVFLKSRDPFIINFYESNCSACIDLNKQWEALSTELKGSVRVSKINISEAQNHKLEDDLRIVKYPTIRYYKNGPKKVNQYTEYEGVRKKFSILEWVKERLNEKVEKADITPLNKQNYETLCKGTKNTCIISFLDGSEPEDTQSRIQKLALEHINKPVTFLVANKGEQDAFAAQVGVTSYPDTVMIYCKLKKIYRMGELNIENIDNTINEISLGNRNNFVRYNFVETVN